MEKIERRFKVVDIVKDGLQIAATLSISVVAVFITRASSRTQSQELQLKLSSELLAVGKDQAKAFALIKASHDCRESTGASPKEWALMRESLFQILDNRKLPYETRKAANLEFVSYLDKRFPRTVSVQVFAYPDEKNQKFRAEMIELWQKEMPDCSFVAVTGPDNDGIWSTNDFRFGIEYNLLHDWDIGRQFAAMANRVLPFLGEFHFLEQFPYDFPKGDADIRVFINDRMLFEHDREKTEETERVAQVASELFKKYPKEAQKISERQHEKHR